MSHGEHDGPCVLWINALYGGTDKSGRDLLREAIEWAMPLDEFDDLLDTAKKVFDLAEEKHRTAPATDIELEVTTEQREATYALCEEARNYWQICDYATDEDESVRWLGQLSQASHHNPGVCFAHARRPERRAAWSA